MSSGSGINVIFLRLKKHREKVGTQGNHREFYLDLTVATLLRLLDAQKLPLIGILEEVDIMNLILLN